MNNVGIQVISLSKMEIVAAMVAIDVVIKNCPGMEQADAQKYGYLVNARAKLRRLYFGETQDFVASS